MFDNIALTEEFSQFLEQLAAELNWLILAAPEGWAIRST